MNLRGVGTVLLVGAIMFVVLVSSAIVYDEQVNGNVGSQSLVKRIY